MAYHPSLLSRACKADHPNHLATAACHLHIWELHVGTVQLFIVGPGPDAWLACSELCYSGQIGTEEERALARRAVSLLNLGSREDREAGVTQIAAALLLAKDQNEDPEQ